MQKFSTLVVSMLLLVGTGLSQSLMQRSTGQSQSRQKPEIQIVKADKKQVLSNEETVFQLPFVENFNCSDYGEDYEEIWKERWTYDNNISSSWDGGYGEPGYVRIYNKGAIVSKQIEIKQGEAHICLYARKASNNATLLLWYGTSSEIADMKLIDSVIIDSTGFTPILRYFEVAEDGRYYFAIQVNGVVGQSVMVDALEIANGEYVPQPVLSVSNVQPPMPGCEENISMKVSVGNQGSEAAYGFTVNYAVNDRTPVSLRLEDTIEAGKYKTIEIENIPLLENGANRIQFSASEHPFLIGTQIAYNYLFRPPHEFDFSKYEMIDKTGIDEGMDYIFPIAWNSEMSPLTEEMIDSIKYTYEPDAPFMSGCITLESNVRYDIKFDCRGGLDNGHILQRGKLLIGKAGSDWTTWDIVWHDSLISTNWLHKNVQISVPQSGQYAIAFIKGSEPGISINGKLGGSDVDVMGLQIKKVSIEPAEAPDIRISSLNLPLSACDLEEEIEISFVCISQDSLPIEGFSAWYSVNDTLWVEEFFDTVLQKSTRTTLSFTSKLLLSPGRNIIKVGISGAKHSPQVLQKKCNRWLPVYPPYTIDFNNGDMVGISGAWFFGPWESEETEYTVGHNEKVPGTTRCFSLRSNTSYRIAFDYHAGSSLYHGLEIIPDECMLFVYPVGSDWKSGERIWYEPEVFSERKWENAEVEFKVKADGEYAFAFMLGNTSYSGFYIRDISISEFLDYDVRLNNHQDFGVLMPLDQVSDLVSTPFMLENRGRLPLEKIHVGALLNQISVGQTEITGIEDAVFGQLEMNIRNVRIGDTGILKIQASIVGHEEEDLNPDHEIEYSFVVTDTVMSHYKADTIDITSGIGFNTGQVGNGMGMPFVFHVQDTLTSISVGWAESPYGSVQDVQLVIYNLNQDYQTLGEVIYSTAVHRGKEAGWCTYSVPDLKLYGTYFVEVVQNSVYNYAIGRAKEKGYLYLHYSGESKLSKQKSWGTPAIRLNLGHQGRPLSVKDIAAETFIEPYASVGAFSINQPIRVKIKNHGSDIYPQVKVYCNVNGRQIGQTEISLDPYVSAEAVFTADLSLPETTYELCAFTALEEDGDRSNDTIRMTLHTVPALDPYVMDFEYCGDFAVDGFEPAWTTVDVDGMYTYGWEGLNFPHTFEPMGFIAFNPKATLPPIDVEQAPEMAPYQGIRFGASFATGPFGMADDWLISPKLKMPASGSEVSFWVKSFTSTYGYDEYEVKVSETDNQPSSFKTVGGLREAPSWAWTQVKVDLSEYNGREIYVAINRTQPENEAGFVFMIDDIRISKPGAANENTALAQQLSLYPNPIRNEMYLFASGLEIEKVEIFNTSGHKFFSSGQNFRQNGFRINVAGWQTGLYFARVWANGKQAVIKFTVVR